MKAKESSQQTLLSLMKETLAAEPTTSQQYPNAAYLCGQVKLINIEAIAPVLSPILAMQGTAIKAGKLPFNIAQTAMFEPKAVEPLLSAETKQHLHDSAWGLANFTAVSAVICTSIVLVQSPVKTMLTSLTKNNTLLPPHKGGLVNALGTLYCGIGNNLAGSSIRTFYVTGTVKYKPHEEAQPTTKLGFVAASSLGELIVTQVPESLATLKKAQILPEKFDWKTSHNVSQLMKGGFMLRYLAGVANISCLFISKSLTKKLPIDNKEVASVLAGVMSGMLAAVGTYPFASLKDYMLVQATVKDGKLIQASTLSVLKSLSQELKTNPKATMKKFGKNAAKQLPMRMALTGVIFAIISGWTQTLGAEPLQAIAPGLQPKQAGNRSGFFKGPEEKALVTVETTAESSHQLKN